MIQVAAVRSLTVLAIALEALAKLSLLGTLFALFVASGDPLRVATIAAAISALSTAARTLVKGELLRRRFVDVFGATEAALGSKSITSIAVSRDKHTSGSLFQAAFEVSSAQATSFPDAVASIVVLCVLLVTVAVRLGPQFVAMGVVGALAMYLVLSPLRSRARRVADAAFKGHTRAMRMLDALMFGSFEVRGAGADELLSNRLRALVSDVARFERQAHWLGITSALIPAALAIAIVLVPREWMVLLLRDKLGEASVLVAAGVSALVSLVAAAEALARSAPQRASLSAFLGRPVGLFGALDEVRPHTAAARGPAPTSFVVEDFSHRYASDRPATPSHLAFELRGSGGLALVGPNGAGKTTTLMALLGLVESRAVRVDDRAPSPSAWASIRQHVCVLPQRAHVVSDETIGWHLSLFGATTLDEAALGAALDRFGLRGFLDERAKRRGCAISELTMGELSGGEQRRVLLARVALSDARLFLLDEPEVGLDEASRRRLRAFLEELAGTRMVLLVCHHTSVIPEGWRSVDVGTNEVRSEGEPAIVQ